MPKIRNIKQAVEKALTLLALKEYEKPNEVINIARILIAQVHILELYKMRYTRFDIAGELGVNEKTVRVWLKADHVPSFKHAIALERLYEKKKSSH